MSEAKDLFYDSLLKAQLSKRGNSVSLTAERYLNILHALCGTSTSEPLDSHTLRRYEVLALGDERKLIKRRTSMADPILCFATNEEVYDIIKEHHLYLGHGGIVRTYASVSRKMANITREMVELYIDMCPECAEKRSRSAHPFYSQLSTVPGKEGSQTITPSTVPTSAPATPPVVSMESKEEESYNLIMSAVCNPQEGPRDPGPPSVTHASPMSIMGVRQQNMAAIVNSLNDRQRQQAKIHDIPGAGNSGAEGNIPLPLVPSGDGSSGNGSQPDREMMHLSPGTESEDSHKSVPSHQGSADGDQSQLSMLGGDGEQESPIRHHEGLIMHDGAVIKAEIDSPDMSEMFYQDDESDIAVSDNTLKANQQAVKMFKDFLTSRCMNTDLTTYTKEELAACLKDFYSGLRKRDGGCYKMNTLHVFRSGINRHLANVDIVNDLIFKDANQVFHSQIAEARRTRRDNNDHSPLLSEDDFNRIYNNVVFDLSNPKTLQWKVFFDTMLYLHRRGDNIKMMSRNTFSLVEGERRYVTYVPSTNDGNRMYEIPGDPLCPVKSYEKYISKLQPESPWLWQKPKRSFIPADPCWYEPQPLMFHRPYQLISAICKYAGLSRQYSPQSILVPGAIFIRKRQPGGGGIVPVTSGPGLPVCPPAQPFGVSSWGPFVHSETPGPSRPMVRPHPPGYLHNGHLPVTPEGVPPIADHPANQEFGPSTKYRRISKHDLVGPPGAPSLALGGEGLEHMESTVTSSQSPSGGMPPLAACIEYYIREGSLFCCEHCGILFLERSTMFLHKGLHGTDQKWQCSVCKQTCSSRNEFTLHIINNLHRK